MAIFHSLRIPFDALPVHDSRGWSLVYSLLTLENQVLSHWKHQYVTKYNSYNLPSCRA